MEGRRSFSWNTLVIGSGFLLFLFFCAHRAPSGGGAPGFAKTLGIAALVWLPIAGALALLLRRLVGKSRIRFATVFAWVFLVLGIGDASIWVFGKILRSDVLRSIAREIRGPVPAQTRDVRTLERADFSFDYPANWTLDEADSDDHVTLDTPNEGMFQLHPFADSGSSERAYQGIVENLRAKVGGCREHGFESWGGHVGRGVDLRGRLYRILPGSVRVFQGAAGERGFVAVEFCYQEGATADEPGFALIRETFEFEEE